MTAPETRQSAAEQLRGVDQQKRTVDIIASTFDLDSYGTRIDPNGWDLEQFKRNPVICLQHDAHGYSASSGLPVANAIPETVRVENNKLVMRIQFPAEGKFPVADQVFHLVADGFLRGVSVGFDPDMSAVEDIEEQVDGRNQVVRIFRKQRLVETSLVTIPSNDAALVQRSRKLNADEKVVRRMTENLEGMLKEQAAARTTLRIGEVSIDVDLRGGDLPAFEREFTKVVGYFEKKQPANREATKALKRFFDLRKEEQPKDETAAWKRMAEILEEPQPEPKVEPSKPEAEKPEEKPEEKKEETPVEPPQVKEEEKTPPPAPPVQEAPAPERKASVHLPLSVLQQLPKLIAETAGRAAVEALQRGVPVKDVDKAVAAAVDALKAAILHP